MIPFLAGLAMLYQQTPGVSSFRLAGVQVTPQLPPEPPLSRLRAVEDGSAKILITPSGGIADRIPAEGEWATLARAHQSSTPGEGALPWHCKIVIFMTADILDKDQRGVYHDRHTAFYTEQLKQIRNAIALFGNAVEAESGGQLRFDPEVTIEDDSFRFELAKEQPFGAEFARSYFEARINGGGFEADDKRFRGPYNSVFYFHPGLSDDLISTELYNSPITGIPFYRVGNGNMVAELTRTMQNAWVGHLVSAAKKHGYKIAGPLAVQRVWNEPRPVRLTPAKAYVAADMWPVLANLSTTVDYPTHYPAKAIAAAKWSDVADNPFVKLPSLSLAELAAREGFSSGSMSDSAPLAFAFGGAEPSSGADNVLTPGEEAFAVVRFASKQLLFVDPALMDVVQSHLSASSNATVLGFLNTPGGTVFVVETEKFGAGQSEAQILGLQIPTSPRGQAVALDASQPLNAYTGTGGFLASAADDAVKGKVVHIKTLDLASHGWVQLVSQGELPGRYLDFWVKASVVQPVQIQVIGQGWVLRRDLFVTKPLPSPSGIPAETSTAIDVSLTPEWQHVVIDLLGDNAPNKTVEGVYLRSPLSAEYSDVPLGSLLDLSLAELKLTDNATATPAKALPEIAPNPTGVDPEARALFAATVGASSSASDKQELAKLLREPDNLVLLNAAYAYTRFVDPAQLAALTDVAHRLSGEVAYAGIAALRKLDSSEAWLAIRETLRLGPFDLNRRFAAEALGDHKDLGLTGDLSVLLTSKSWQTRLTAVSSIAKIPSSGAPIVLLSFLEENDPGVRLGVIKRANTNVDLVVKRLLWYTVNDSSDAIRLWSAIALSGSKNEVDHPEAYRALKDESPTVRRLLIEHLSTHPNEDARSGLQIALSDREPEVRAAAIRALAAMQSLKVEELTRVLGDKDPRVQLALVEVSIAKSIKLPAETVETLKNSIDADVASKARSLG